MLLLIVKFVVFGAEIRVFMNQLFDWECWQLFILIEVGINNEVWERKEKEKVTEKEKDKDKGKKREKNNNLMLTEKLTE